MENLKEQPGDKFKIIQNQNKIYIQEDFEFEQIKQNLLNPKIGDVYYFYGYIRIFVSNVKKNKIIYYKNGSKFSEKIFRFEHLIRSIDNGKCICEFYNIYNYIKEVNFNISLQERINK